MALAALAALPWRQSLPVLAALAVAGLDRAALANALAALALAALALAPAAAPGRPEGKYNNLNRKCCFLVKYIRKNI